MSLRILVTAPLVSLFFFSAFVAAGINVTATCTLSGYSWTFNSLDQSPCVVAAYMLSTCFSGSAIIGPLGPGFGYTGPTHGESNPCQCSTVGYSLMSACVACQDGDPFPWSMYVANCTSTLPPSQFPNPVPGGTRVPHWAILDVTKEDRWGADESYAAGDNPEYGPGAVFGPSGVYTSTSASATGSPKGSSLKAGVIAGGVVGVVAAILIIVAVFLSLRRRPRTSSAKIDGTRAGASQPHMDDTLWPPLPYVRTKFHYPYTQDMPNDQTKFQWYAGPRSVDIPPPGPTSSYIRSGRNTAHMQTPLPRWQTRRYNGFLMPST